jgi:hypothetical protein
MNASNLITRNQSCFALAMAIGTQENAFSHLGPDARSGQIHDVTAIEPEALAVALDMMEI